MKGDFMISNKILFADDEKIFRDTFTKVLLEEGFDVTAVENGKDAINAITKQSYSIVILDVQMPETDGITALAEIIKIRPKTKVIIVTAFGFVDMAVQAIKLGACEYMIKPIIFEDFIKKIRHLHRNHEFQEENKQLKPETNDKFDVVHIIGKSQQMRQIVEMINKVAKNKSNVLITGNTGTGKELIAHAIHSLSSRNSNPFIVVNCAAIPESLLESELFGHKRGSFTSATKEKKGYFEVAEDGTLFLDEIGYMSINCQVKLLRAIEQRQIFPVGATEPVNLNFRLIAATNKNLSAEVNNGLFREDLYYRLNVVNIHLPSLQERREDIPLLTEYFIKKYSDEMGKHCPGVCGDAMQMLMNHEWKGNVRELENVVERTLVFLENNIGQDSL